MIGKISLADAEKLLTDYYNREYEDFDSCTTSFGIKEKYDCDGDPYDCYVAIITISKKIGSIMAYKEIEKNINDIYKDLLVETKNRYATDDYDVNDIKFMGVLDDVQSNRIVEIYFKEKEKVFVK